MTRYRKKSANNSSIFLNDFDITGQNIDILQGVNPRYARRIFFNGKDVFIDALDLYLVIFQLQSRMVQSDIDTNPRRDGIQIIYFFLIISSCVILFPPKIQKTCNANRTYAVIRYTL